MSDVATWLATIIGGGGALAILAGGLLFVTRSAIATAVAQAAAREIVKLKGDIDRELQDKRDAFASTLEREKLAIAQAGSGELERLRSELAKDLESERQAFAKELERLKGSWGWEERRREQAAKVAEVLCLWVTAAKNEPVKADLLRAYSELALWLDVTALREVNKCLSYTGGSFRAALLAARKVIVGADDDLAAREFVTWDL